MCLRCHLRPRDTRPCLCELTLTVLLWTTVTFWPPALMQARTPPQMMLREQSTTRNPQPATCNLQPHNHIQDLQPATYDHTVRRSEANTTHTCRWGCPVSLPHRAYGCGLRPSGVSPVLRVVGMASDDTRRHRSALNPPRAASVVPSGRVRVCSTRPARLSDVSEDPLRRLRRTTPTVRWRQTAPT